MMILGTNNGLSHLWKKALLVLLFLFALPACSNDAGGATPTQTISSANPTSESIGPTAMAPAISVVTTTSIMADWVGNIGGDGVEVFSLVPTGADPHAFQPGAGDVAKIADADLVLSVGMGLEESWLKELLQNAARDPSTIIEMGEIVDPMEFAESHADEVAIIEALSHVVHEVEEGEISPEAALEEIKELLESSGEEEEDEDHGDEGEKEGDEAEEEDEDHGDEDELPAMALAIVKDVEDGRMDASDAIEAIEALTAEGEDEHAGHGHGIEDPHFWFDPLRVKLVVNDIAARLSALDPDRGDTYRANASAYNVRLDELHAWTKQQVSAVPEDRRLLVTSHDSLGYFANLYGFEVVGVVLSITTEVGPSARDLIELVEEVTENGIPAVFGETTVSERLAAAVATESGAKLVRLYSGSLGLEDSGAETYIDMIRTNVERIVEVLR